MMDLTFQFNILWAKPYICIIIIQNVNKSKLAILQIEKTSNLILYSNSRLNCFVLLFPSFHIAYLFIYLAYLFFVLSVLIF